MKAHWLVAIGSALVLVSRIWFAAAAPDPATVGQESFAPLTATETGMTSRGFLETGLRPLYPESHTCPRADSLFAATTRGDGSTRERRFFHGRHSGVDIPVPEGTPVLAIADGVVVYKKVGEHISGIELFVQHALGDTGLQVWLYSQYTHLKEMPAIPIGERVRIGQQIAISGKTGTEGPHYGPRGHPHLHLSTFISPDNVYITGQVFFPPNGQWADPLAVYQGGKIESALVAALPVAEKAARIPFQATDGRRVPEGTRLIWPLACRPR